METEIKRGNITRPQIAKIYTVANKRNIDNELLHTMVYENFGKNHIRELTKYQGIQFIQKLDGNPKNRLKNATRKLYQYVHKHITTQTTITPAQKFKIIKLMEEIKSNSGYKLNELSQRIISKDCEPEWKVYSNEASSLIAGLNKIKNTLRR